MGRSLWIVLSLCACGGADPVLRNAPKPNPAAVAGVAAATAAAITLASPQTASPEANKPAPSDRGVDVKQNVPADVFDRLDHEPPAAPAPAPAQAQPAPAQPAQPPPAPLKPANLQLVPPPPPAP